LERYIHEDIHQNSRFIKQVSESHKSISNLNQFEGILLLLDATRRVPIHVCIENVIFVTLYSSAVHIHVSGFSCLSLRTI